MNKFWFIMILALVSLPLAAQEDLLPEGAYGTTIHGGIKAGERKAYTLDGDRGQVFKAQLTTKGIEKGATLDLIDSSGDSVLGEIVKITKVDAVNLILPKNDKYELQVKAGRSTCSYVLEVTLDDAEPEPPKKPRKVSKPSTSPAPRGGRPSEDDL